MKKKRKVRGVYTVEAAIIIPMVLFTMAGGIGIGIDLYKKAESYAAGIDDVKKYEEINTIHKIRTAGKFGEVIKGGN